jgi:hypothetical protein
MQIDHELRCAQPVGAHSSPAKRGGNAVDADPASGDGSAKAKEGVPLHKRDDMEEREVVGRVWTRVLPA